MKGKGGKKRLNKISLSKLNNDKGEKKMKNDFYIHFWDGPKTVL